MKSLLNARLKRLYCFLALCLFTAVYLSLQAEKAFSVTKAPQSNIPAPGSSLINFATFSDFRNHVLNLIGKAERQIILSTDFLSDGEISSALYLAKYRKVDVRVLLGRRKVNSYLSRLRYLKAQNIPVYLIPPNFAFRDATTMLVDNNLYRASVDLNSLNPKRSAKLQELHPKWIANFVTAVRETMKTGYTANPTPLPMVGRKPGPRPYNPHKRQPSPYVGEQDGSYNYDRSYIPRQAPDGVPTTLPKTPLFEKRLKAPAQTISDDSMEADESAATSNELEFEKNQEADKETNSTKKGQLNQKLELSDESNSDSDGQASTFAPAPTFNRLEGGNYNPEDSVDGSHEN